MMDLCRVARSGPIDESSWKTYSPSSGIFRPVVKPPSRNLRRLAKTSIWVTQRSVAVTSGDLRRKEVEGPINCKEWTEHRLQEHESWIDAGRIHHTKECWPAGPSVAAQASSPSTVAATHRRARASNRRRVNKSRAAMPRTQAVTERVGSKPSPQPGIPSASPGSYWKSTGGIPKTHPTEHSLPAASSPTISVCSTFTVTHGSGVKTR
jgi:hypothetical protein